MTKMIAIVSAVLLAVLGLTATATETGTGVTVDLPETTLAAEDVQELTGTVEEMPGEGEEKYYIIKTFEGQRFQVNVDAATAFDGSTPALGDVIHVFHDGKMTRSIPAQVYAQHIGCHYHTGAIVELTQEGFTLDSQEQIIEVHAQQALLEGLENGQQVKVYTNGVMTMSLPAQVNADLIVPIAAE